MTVDYDGGVRRLLHQTPRPLHAVMIRLLQIDSCEILFAVVIFQMLFTYLLW